MYEQFYGLGARAFQLTPDPQFYFESASHKRALSYLGYGLNQGEGFIVITGEVGAGKSTLVAHLMQRVDPAALTVAQIVTTALDGAGLVHMVAKPSGWWWMAWTRPVCSPRLNASCKMKRAPGGGPC